MRVHHLTARDYACQPWRNGGGRTTELAAGWQGEHLLWRISVADVERPGPFSDFSGFARTLLLLAGNGMALSFQGAPEVVVTEPLKPLRFDGAWRTTCRLLDGAVRDFNLVADESRVEAALEVIRMPAHERLEVPLACDAALLYVARGAVAIDLARSSLALQAHETLRLDLVAPGAVTMTAATAPSALVLIRIQSRIPPR